MDEARNFFADWTVRHPDNENGELLQHCGPWPISVAQEKPTIGYPLAFDHPGAVEAQAKLVEGPYIHHCVGIHKNVVPVLYEACKYIGIRPDLYDPIEEEVKAYLRGE